MAGAEGPGGVGPAGPLIPGDTPSTEEASGKYRGLTVEKIDVTKNIPSDDQSPTTRTTTKLSDRSVTAASEPRRTEPVPISDGKAPASAESRETSVQSLPSEKESMNVAIGKAKKKPAWKKLEKIANPKKKPEISDNGFKRLLKHLSKTKIDNKDVSRLMVMFAGDKFERGEITRTQMESYMKMFMAKYISAKASEQLAASIKLIVPVLPGKSDSISETVQVADLLVDVESRLEATTSESPFVTNMRPDIPVHLFGETKVDLEETSKK